MSLSQRMDSRNDAAINESEVAIVEQCIVPPDMRGAFCGDAMWPRDGRPDGSGLGRTPSLSAGSDRPSYRSRATCLGLDDHSGSGKACGLESQTSTRRIAISAFGGQELAGDRPPHWAGEHGKS